jgi:hypothetical protein
MNTLHPDLSSNQPDSVTSQGPQEGHVEAVPEKPGQFSYGYGLVVDFSHSGLKSGRLPHIATGIPCHITPSYRNETALLQTSAVPTVQAIKEAVLKTFGDAYASIAHANVYHLNDVTSNDELLHVQSTWLLSTASLPKLLPSSKCWANRVPSRLELVADTIGLIARSGLENNSTSTFSVNYQGEVGQRVQAGLAIAQLLDPTPRNPVSILSLRLPVLEELGFCCPVDLCSVIEPMEETPARANLTPKFSFVDLHTGKRIRIFFHFPFFLLTFE